MDFKKTMGDGEFQKHTSCISEAQKFEKTVYRGEKKDNKRKGQPSQSFSKQEEHPNAVLQSKRNDRVSLDQLFKADIRILSLPSSGPATTSATIISSVPTEQSPLSTNIAVSDPVPVISKTIMPVPVPLDGEAQLKGQKHGQEKKRKKASKEVVIELNSAIMDDSAPVETVLASTSAAVSDNTSVGAKAPKPVLLGEEKQLRIKESDRKASKRASMQNNTIIPNGDGETSQGNAVQSGINGIQSGTDTTTEGKKQRKRKRDTLQATGLPVLETRESMQEPTALFNENENLDEELLHSGVNGVDAGTEVNVEEKKETKRQRLGKGSKKKAGTEPTASHKHEEGAAEVFRRVLDQSLQEDKAMISMSALLAKMEDVDSQALLGQIKITKGKKGTYKLVV